MASGRVPTASVVVFTTWTTLEGSCLVDGDGATTILVLHVRILNGGA